MTERIFVAHTTRGIRIVLPADTCFDDYREVRARVVAMSAGHLIELDLTRLRTLPTWVLGFLLHVEDSLAVRLAVRVDPSLLELFAITGMLRFVEGAAPAALAPSVPRGESR